jgi:hypothetical protein
MDKRLPYLFISYSHSDSVFANKFSKRLKNAGIDHFLDTDCVMWGDNIHSRIQEEFEKVTHLVVLISPGSLESQWVSYEMGYAHGRNIKLVPYLLHPSTKIPAFIANIRYLKTPKEEASFIESLKRISDTNKLLKKNNTNINSDENFTDDYCGWYEITVDKNTIDEYYAKGIIKVNSIMSEQKSNIPINSFVRFKTSENNYTAIARLMPDTQKLQPVIKLSKEGIWGIHPRNMEQVFALDLLNDDAVKLVTLVGNSHTDKLRLAIASGFQKVFEEEEYQRIIISRPLTTFQTKEMSLLPKSVMPWMQPYVDNLELLISKDSNLSYMELVQKGCLEIVPLSAILGRIIRNAYIIVDNSHGLTVDEIK